MNLDKDNYDTAKWDPFGEIIKPRDIVVLKLNRVMHKNGLSRFSTDCLITHGSVIRVIVDCVYIALKGKRKIIIGNAPLQKCDLKEYL